MQPLVIRTFNCKLINIMLGLQLVILLLLIATFSATIDSATTSSGIHINSTGRDVRDSGASDIDHRMKNSNYIKQEEEEEEEEEEENDEGAEIYIHADDHGGLSYTYYLSSCPRAYDLVRERMQFYLSQDPSQAAGILRIFFHDCFVQGCDASILLEVQQYSNKNSNSITISEQNALPNLNSLRTTSFKIIDDIKASLEAICPGIVSCADTLALAARDSVFMVGGPWIPMPTGRRDQLVPASNQTVIAKIPIPTQSFSALKKNFKSKGLSTLDMVALSGAHTIGQSHCLSINSQLSPSISLDLDPSFAQNLSKLCHPQAQKAHLTLHLDNLTPNRFDNAYFKNVLSKRSLFHSDATLLDDPKATFWIQMFAKNEKMFFKHFSISFNKMSQLGVLVGKQGEVRMSCTMPN